jgi:hypothetical protein
MKKKHASLNTGCHEQFMAIPDEIKSACVTVSACRNTMNKHQKNTISITYSKEPFVPFVQFAPMLNKVVLTGKSLDYNQIQKLTLKVK